VWRQHSTCLSQTWTGSSGMLTVLMKWRLRTCILFAIFANFFLRLVWISLCRCWFICFETREKKIWRILCLFVCLFVCVLACATAQGGVTRSHWLRTDMSRPQLLPQKVEDEWSGAGSLSTAQRLNAAFEEVLVSAFPDLPSGKGALLGRCLLSFF
jgi:hypothetical protein